MALGDIIREFAAPVEAQGNGRAVAFDGQFLYLTTAGDRNIHRVTTTGTFVSSIPTRIAYGALHFDSSEGVFWAGGYEGTSEIDKVSITGNVATVLSTINYSITVPIDPDDPFPAFVDGITVDPVTDTIFFSTDEGVSVYNIRKSGLFISSFKTPPQGLLPNGLNSGVESDRINLWLSLFAGINGAPRDIVQTDTAGNETSNRFPTGADYICEDLEFDNITFAPRCVLWSNEATFGINRIRAWEIPCPELPCPQANPQSCCQVVIDHKTQLVPPARRGTVRHTKTVEATVEKVCPEKVVICGVVRKRIDYLLENGRTNTIFDDFPFQCFIDRNDANEGEVFHVTGATILCTVFAREANFGGPNNTLAFKFVEKEIIKVCIRKGRRPFIDPTTAVTKAQIQENPSPTQIQENPSLPCYQKNKDTE